MNDFQNPVFLLTLLPLVIFAILFFAFKQNTKSLSIPISSRQLVAQRSGLFPLIFRLLPLLRFISIALLLLSIARPGTRVEYSDVTSRGIDIMIVQDISLSMLGMDFAPNRLAVSKEVVNDFVSKRQSDRLGMVIFSGEAFLQCPLTSDSNILHELIDDIEYDSISLDLDGTAIGDALGLAAARLSQSDAKSKIILLLTDGANNRGKIPPETAAEVCTELGIRIYVIGIGSEGTVHGYIPRGKHQGYIKIGSNFDENLMKKISDDTGGRYFHAQSSEVFFEAMDEIDKLEKSEYKVRTYSEFSDSFFPFVVAAAIIFMFEFILRAFIFRKIP